MRSFLIGLPDEPRGWSEREGVREGSTMLSLNFPPRTAIITLVAWGGH